MKSTQTLIRLAFVATIAASSTAFADASDSWIAHNQARNLPVDPSPSKPYVSPMSLLVEMSLTDGDASRAVIARRVLETYARKNGNVQADGGGEDKRVEAKGVACDIEFLSKLAQSEGSHPGDDVGCARN